MIYRRVNPSAAVRRYVEFYWILEDRLPVSCVQRIVPDGRPGIILNFAKPFESCSSGSWKSQPDLFLVGQITGPLLLRPSGSASMLGIQFRPDGAARLLGVPISELNDSAIALEDLSRRLSRQFERIREFSSPIQAVAAVDRILRGFELAGAGDNPISYAVSEIERARGLMSMSTLADRIGWSTRQLQRRFKDSVGISPKLFGRMQRFRDVFRAVDGPATSWVRTAVYCGYYDQAHLIRDFREFSGTTPTALLEQELDLSRRFILTRSMSHFSKTALSGSR